MIVENLIQNTDEWLEWRRGHLGASEASIVAGQNNYKDIQWLWREKLGMNEREEQSVWARRGQDLEPLARELYIQEYSEISPTVFVSDEVPFMSASVDGHSLEHNFIVEIKCPMRKSDVKKMANGWIKPEHYPQIQHQLFVTKANYCDYLAFDGLNQIYVNRVWPDHRYQRNLVRFSKWVWHKIENKAPIKEYDITITPKELTR